MKVQVKKYGKGLPGDTFYYEIVDVGHVVYDGRFNKPAVIYTLNENQVFKESYYTYKLYRKKD